MSVIKSYSRISHHRLTTAGLTFSVPVQEDFTITGASAWGSTDLANAEFGINLADRKIYYRTDSVINEIITGNNIGTGLTFSNGVLSNIGGGTGSGTSGSSGSSGSSGTSGSSGSSGTSGTSGTSGANGTSGSSGSSGFGSSGTSGTSGTNGATGTSGTSGTSGISGSSGSSGIGTSGTSGSSGSSGGVNGTGTTNYISKFTGATTIGNSLVQDNGVQTIFPAGNTTVPSITFVSGTVSGFCLDVANNPVVVSNQVGVASFNSDGILVNVNGSLASPAIRWNTGQGIYRTSNNNIKHVLNSQVALNLETSGGTPQLQIVDGSYATPSLTFINDKDTGLYRPSSGNISVLTNGMVSAVIAANGGIGQIQAQDGDGVTASISFINDTDTGFWRPSSGQVGVLTNGQSAGRFYQYAGVASFCAEDGTASRPTIGFYNDLDTGIYRPADNKVAITTNGANSAVFGATNSIETRTYFNKAVNHYVEATSTSGTYSIDMSLANVFNLTLIGNTTLTTTNEAPGSYVLLVKQDNTGNRNLTLINDGRFIGATALSIATASNAVSIVQLIRVGTQSVVSFDKNLITL